MRLQFPHNVLSGLLAASLTAVALPASAAGVTVKIDPVAVAVPTGGARAFKATVTGAANTAVTWTVNDLAPGNATIGTIDTAGNYVAPAQPPAGWIVLVKATSVADPTASATSTVTVRNPIPSIGSLIPAALSPGPFTLTVNGSKFMAGAQVLWNGAALATNFVNANKLTATGTAAQLGNIAITVANPGPAAVSSAVYLPVTSNVVVSVSPSNASVLTGGTLQFQATVTGSANQNVTWKVNGVANGDSVNGQIDASGLYAAPNVIPSGGMVTISALAAADGITLGNASISFQDPLAITFGRFLSQATFGPTPQSMAHVKQVGMTAFLDEQFALPESPFPPLATAQRSDAVDAFVGNAVNGADQLRQRVIFALSEIIVIAMNKNTNGNEIVPWLQILSKNAFGNYRQLLRDITLDASMGKYLDMVNSTTSGSGMGAIAANENYAREVMQLFSIGLYQMNLDGSYQVDPVTLLPLPTYTQTDVAQMAKALTGWTYSNPGGTSNSGGNWSYYPGPMIPAPGRHNTSMKTILGTVLPANQTITQDLDAAIDILFNHPNIGPFISTRLIRALVTSNPSPAYIARVAAVFNGNSQTPRGDMQAVIRAILMDQEARDDAPPPSFGRLRTPVQHWAALSRALNIPVGGASGVAYLFYGMNEGILDAPSVFGHYSPMYHVPKSPLFGPEFQIYSPSDAVNRANFFYGMMYNPWPIHPALQVYANAASNVALINAVDNALLLGRMSPALRSAIAAALPAQGDQYQRALTALYLTVTSGEYLIQR